MKKYLFFVLCLFFSSHSFGKNLKSPFNDLSVEVGSTDDYSFIVSGHFFGDGTNNSHFPANTILANLDWMNSSNASLLVSLGDLFKDISNDMTNYDKSLFQKLKIPLFNSVGNHDLTADIYQKNYGNTYFSFLIKNDLHIILDTEKNDGSIKGSQLEFLEKVSEEVNDGGISNVFIYGHRTIWKESYVKLDGLFNDNTQSVAQLNFESDVFPIVSRMAERAKIYFFAGAIGASAPASFFYFLDETNNITYIATAIRSLPRDAVLIVNSNGGNISFSTQSLTGQDLMPLEEYSADYWIDKSKEGSFNWALLPHYLKGIIAHSYFWYGILFSFLCVMLVRCFKRFRN